MTETEPDLFERNSFTMLVHTDELAAADETRRILDRRRRITRRLSTLGNIAYGHPLAWGGLSTPALDEAMERGIRADSEEWAVLVATEARRAATEQTAERRRAVYVLERYNRLVKASNDRREAENRAARAEIRSTTPVVPLTVETLCARLGIPEAVAQHVVQPYCTCDEQDGWYACDHARDLGIAGT